MKMIFGLIAAGLVMYSVYIDLTVGTLPKTFTQRAEAQTQVVPKESDGKGYFSEKVEPGDTVISIVERQLDKALPVSIQDLISDFRELNQGKSPENIQIGSTYKFPDYSK
jgi:hypothetical protein